MFTSTIPNTRMYIFIEIRKIKSVWWKNSTLAYSIRKITFKMYTQILVDKGYLIRRKGFEYQLTQILLQTLFMYTTITTTHVVLACVVELCRQYTHFKSDYKSIFY